MILLYCSYGAVAQLARATGSYPVGREFESPRRYQVNIKKGVKKHSFCYIVVMNGGLRRWKI